MERPLRKAIIFGLILQWDNKGLAKSCITHGLVPTRLSKSCQILTIELSRCKANNDIRKVVHFDRLKLCPKNICLDGKLTNKEPTSPQELIPPTENSLQIGHDLEIVDDDNDEADDATGTTPHTPMDTTSQAELAMPSGRYTR